MNACRFMVPKYLEAEEGHFVACHLYDKEVMADPAKIDRDYAAWLLERLDANADRGADLPELERVDPAAALDWVLRTLPTANKAKLLDLLLDSLARLDKAKYFEAVSGRLTDPTAKFARGKRRAALFARLKDAEIEKHADWLRDQALAAGEKDRAAYLELLQQVAPAEAEAVAEKLKQDGTQG